MKYARFFRGFSNMNVKAELICQKCPSTGDNRTLLCLSSTAALLNWGVWPIDDQSKKSPSLRFVHPTQDDSIQGRCEIVRPCRTYLIRL